jgi:oligopeptidase B
VIGTKQSEDLLLHHEEDDLFYLHAWKSKSGNVLFAKSGSTETSEVRFLRLDGETEKAADASMSMVQPRTFKLRYDVEHLPEADGLLLWTNVDDAINNRLMFAPLATPGKEHWRELIEYDATRKIEDVDVFRNFVVIEGRQDGLTQLWISDIDSKAEGGAALAAPKRVEWPESTYEVGLSTNMEFDTDVVRIHYSSLTTPVTWQDYQPATASFTVIKEQPVLNFDKSLYTCRQVFATASDGTKVCYYIFQSTFSLYSV